MFSAKVVDGRLDVPDGVLADGTVVTVLISDDEDDGFTLSIEEENELLEAIAACERGDFVDGLQLLRETDR